MLEVHLAQIHVERAVSHGSTFELRRGDIGEKGGGVVGDFMCNLRFQFVRDHTTSRLDLFDESSALLDLLQYELD